MRQIEITEFCKAPYFLLSLRHYFTIICYQSYDYLLLYEDCKTFTQKIHESAMQLPLHVIHTFLVERDNPESLTIRSFQYKYFLIV